MTHAWVELTHPDGRSVAAPTEAQLAAALAEVYSGNVQSPDGGPGTAVLRFGYDDGLMYEVEVAAGGHICYAEWSDRDCEIALASPRKMAGAAQEAAMQLWMWLAQRQVAKIRSQAWLSDD
jgi:hypothetical protein